MNQMVEDRVQREVADRFGAMVEMRRHLHAMPETAFKEAATSAYISDRLSSFGLDVHEGIGGTGLVGVLDGGLPGDSLMVRADFDGLPVREETGLPFASRNGNMHACGHDGHVTMALTAAEILTAAQSEVKGRIVFLFQPAEEVVGGATAMIDDGVLDRFPADRVIGTHLWNQVPLGHVGVNNGTVFASANIFNITVTGFGGHGALPHLTVDPIACASQIVSATQTVISRELSPSEMGVVTFGSIHGGTASNVIADQVVLRGTIRAYDASTHETICAAVRRIAEGVGRSMRCEVEYVEEVSAPPVVNNADIGQWVTGLAMQTVGETNVSGIPPISVGDDMAEFMDRVPGTYFILGAQKDGAAPHHNAKFDFDERCLPIGTEIFVRAALDDR